MPAGRHERLFKQPFEESDLLKTLARWLNCDLIPVFQTKTAKATSEVAAPLMMRSANT
jgi:hypothetical protein